MEFTITINEQLTLVGNVPLPAGSVLKGVTTGFDTTPEDHDVIPWKGLIYASQADADNNEKPLVVKNLTEGRTLPNQRAMGVGVMTSAVKSTDMDTYVVSKTNNKYKLNAASGDAFLEVVKADLVNKASVTIGNLSGVIDQA